MLSSPVHSFFFPLSKEVPCAQGLHRITLTSFCGFWGDGDDDSHSFWDSLEERLLHQNERELLYWKQSQSCLALCCSAGVCLIELLSLC